jgi:hypothetical protein
MSDIKENNGRSGKRRCGKWRRHDSPAPGNGHPHRAVTPAALFRCVCSTLEASFAGVLSDVASYRARTSISNPTGIERIFAEWMFDPCCRLVLQTRIQRTFSENPRRVSEMVRRASELTPGAHAIWTTPNAVLVRSCTWHQPVFDGLPELVMATLGDFTRVLNSNEFRVLMSMPRLNRCDAWDENEADW